MVSVDEADGAFAIHNFKANMNKDQVKGVLKDAEGTVQEAAGEATGSKEQQAKGLVKQVEGKSQKALGDAKEALHDATKK